MFALCIESSHQRGMGHLFRMLRFAIFLRQRREKIIFFLNDHQTSILLLEKHQFDYEIVDLHDFQGQWESKLIVKYHVDVWVNDRLDIAVQHGLNVKQQIIKLVTLDDRGDAAKLADLNVSALIFDGLGELKGQKILTGERYLILDSDINSFRRVRKKLDKVLVSMGGSDTYGVSIEVVQALKESCFDVTVIVGPGFEHLDKLQAVMPERFSLLVNVPSLVKKFIEFDLVFTGGGVTPFEACASGLPCVVIATEKFEIPVGQYLESTGACVYAGYKYIKELEFLEELDIEYMSKKAMLKVDTKGAERVYTEILKI